MRDWRALLKELAPRAREFYVLSFVEHGDAALSRAGVTDDLLLSHFLSQVLHESGGLSRCEEGLSYSSAERLSRVFPRYFPSADSARPYVNSPEELANRVYGKRLGNDQPGDGWLYRGRGMIQITGKANYARIGKFLNLDLVSNPVLINTSDWAVDVACAYWALAKCNAPASKDDIVGVTKLVNGGQNGLEDRIRWLAMVKHTLGVAA